MGKSLFKSVAALGVSASAILFTVPALADSCPTVMGLVSNSVSAGENNTRLINDAINANQCVALPRGAFWVSVTAGGVVVKSNTTIKGAGAATSMLIAKDRSPGGVIRRAAPVAKGDYVENVTLQDFGVVINTATYNRLNPVMIGIDLRSISGSTITNVYVGNTPFGEAVAATASQGWITAKSDLAQGIGILACTKAGGDDFYSGGERNVIHRARIFGAKIGVSIDDPDLCPNSGAHGTVVSDGEIGTVQYGIAQQSRYAAGVTIRGNTVQDCVAGGGQVATLAGYVLYGYANTIEGGYMEAASPNAIKAILFGPDSRGNRVNLGYVSIGKPNKETPQPLSSTVVIRGVNNRVSGYDITTGNWYNSP